MLHFTLKSTQALCMGSQHVQTFTYISYRGKSKKGFRQNGICPLIFRPPEMHVLSVSQPEAIPSVEKPLILLLSHSLKFTDLAVLNDVTKTCPP